MDAYWPQIITPREPQKCHRALEATGFSHHQEDAVAIVLLFAFVGRGMCRIAKAAIAVKIARIALA